MTIIESPHPNINEIYNEMRRLSMDTIPLQLQQQPSTPSPMPIDDTSINEAEQSSSTEEEKASTLSVDNAKKLWSNYHRTNQPPSQLNNNNKETMFKRQQSKSSTTQTTLDESDTISGALSISDYYPHAHEETKMSFQTISSSSNNNEMPKHWPRANASLDESSNKQQQQQGHATMPKQKKKKPTYRRRSMAYLPSTTNSSNSENCNWNDRIQEILSRPPGMSLQAAQLQQKKSPPNSNSGEGRKRAAYQRRHSVEITCPTCPFKSTSQVREIIFNCNGKPPTKDMLHMTSVLYERQKEASDKSATSYESSQCTVPTEVDTSRKASLYRGGGEGILDESYVSTLSTPSVLLTDARSVGMNKSVSGHAAEEKSGMSSSDSGKSRSSHAEEKSSAQSSSGVGSHQYAEEKKKPINRRRHTIEEDMNCLEALQKLGLSSGNVVSGGSIKSKTSNGQNKKKTDTKKTRAVYKERRRSSDSDVPSKEALKKAGLRRRNSIEKDMNCLDALKKLDLSNSATSGLDNSPSSHLESSNKSKNQVSSIQQLKKKSTITKSSDIKNVKASFRRRHTVDEDMNCLQALKKLDLSSSTTSSAFNQASLNLNSEPSTSSSSSSGGSRDKPRDKSRSRKSSSKKNPSNNGSFTSTSSLEQIEQDVKMRIIRRRRHSMQDQLHNLKVQQLQIQMQLQLQKDMAAKKKYNEEVLQTSDVSSKKKDVSKKTSDKAESTVPRPRRVTPISDEQSAPHLNNKSRRRSQSNSGTVKSSKSSPTSSPSSKSKSRAAFKERRRSSDSDVPSTNKWTEAMKRYVEETNAQDTIARYVKEMESKDGTDMNIDQYVDEMEADLFSTDEEDNDDDEEDNNDAEDDGEVSDIIRMVSGRNSSLSRFLHHQLNDFDQGHQDGGAVKRRTRSTKRRSSRTPTTLASSFSTPSIRSQVYEMKPAVAHQPSRNAFFVHTSPLDESVSSLEASFRSGYDYGTDHNGVSLGSYGRSIAGRHFMGMGVPAEEKRVSKKKKVNGWFQRRRRRRASCTDGLDVSGSSGSYEEAKMKHKQGGVLPKQEKSGSRFNRRRRFSDCGITGRRSLSRGVNKDIWDVQMGCSDTCKE